MRTKLVKSDKESILKIANDLDAFISELIFPELKTKEATALCCGLLEKIKSDIHDFEIAGQELI